MNITEPTTMITDYLLGSLALVLGWRLYRSGNSTGNRARQLWAGAFLGLAAASFLGGTHHGFQQMLTPFWVRFTWRLTLISIGVLSFFLFASVTKAFFRVAPASWLLGLACLQFVLYCSWVWGHDEFLWAIADYAPSIVYVLVLQSIAWARGQPSGRWIVGGMLVSVVAAGIQQSGLKLHEHFNHNNVYHLVQMVGAYLLYRGGLLLVGVPGQSAAGRPPVNPLA